MIVNILVTAGPTREPLDPVRYLTNRSSGKMGYALARVARERGHRVRLVTGPVAIEPPRGVTVTRVLSAREMLRAVSGSFPWADALIMAAAVSDWRPAHVAAGKMKKKGRTLVIRLVKNPDILEGVSRMKGGRTVVGFAAETGDPVAEALHKLRRKKLDLVVANDVSVPGSGFDADSNLAALVFRDGTVVRLNRMRKTTLARIVVEHVEKIASVRKGRRT